MSEGIDPTEDRPVTFEQIVVDGSDGIDELRTGAVESWADELVLTLIDTSDVAASTSEGSGGVATMSVLVRLGNRGALAVFLMLSTISCPFEFRAKVP